ncbi:MAG: protein kinase, partial [Gemmatimonadota bacterium]|nr:protein kinase [Gemmatimonadota bacterium]
MLCSMDILERLRTGLSARYRIDEEVGLGGMARVYRAEDLKHGRRVAVKVLRPEVALGLGPDRFRREIDIAAGLNHPNILGLHDSGEVDGLLYFVMPYVDGESLRTRIDREGALPLDECVRIAQEIGEALQYAHDRGLVHRDVKPENILFLEGHALVCDFGIAKATQGAQEHLTHTGMAVGTLSYMSPEQMSDGAEVDGRADLYALGCLVHEMLSGRAPFSASTPGATLAKKLAGAASALDSRDASIPGTVRRVVSRALAPDLTERFSTMREFTSSLAHAATALAVEEDTRRRRKARALRWGTLLAGAVVIGAAGLRLARYISRPAIQRIAVLPLETALADPSQDFFAQGVHQDLVLEMARFGLRVINSASVARYAGVDQRIRLIAEELDVDGILSGSAALADDNVTITMVLVGGESEEVLWAASFSSHIRNVLELYRDITLAVAERIGVPLSADAETLLADPPTVDPQVFEALLQARFHTRRLTEEGLATALEYYELVLDRDPRSAEAWFGVAQVWAFRAQQGLVSAEEATRQGDEAMAKVAEFDPGFSRDPAGLALRRTWVEWNWSEGETAFREALSRDPTDAV